jgi:hypothetical protein
MSSYYGALSIGEREGFEKIWKKCYFFGLKANANAKSGAKSSARKIKTTKID